MKFQKSTVRCSQGENSGPRLSKTVPSHRSFEAPLLDYSAVNSRRDFTPHPLGDNKVRMLLKAPRLHPKSPGPESLHPKLDVLFAG